MVACAAAHPPPYGHIMHLSPSPSASPLPLFLSSAQNVAGKNKPQRTVRRHGLVITLRLDPPPPPKTTKVDNIQPADRPTIIHPTIHRSHNPFRCLWTNATAMPGSDFDTRFRNRPPRIQVICPSKVPSTHIYK